jgi:hypothetical protein
MKNFKNCTTSCEFLPTMQNIPLGTSKNAQDVFGTCLVLSVKSSSWDCVYLGVPRGIVYILEVPPEILCIIRSHSWDFVHFRKILVGFCALFEVENAQNPMRNFQKGTKSHIELPKMYKIPRETSKSAQNQTRIFKKCTKSNEDL